MKRFLSSLFLLMSAVLAPGTAAAQATDPMMEAVRPGYERVKSFLLRSAEQMSEEDLLFRPTEEVRHGLALLGHIADSQHYYCSVALGESTPHDTQFEATVTTREGMIEALRESFEYCDQAYAQADAVVMQPAPASRSGAARLSTLLANTVHNWEHYGNLVTYMRLRGQVPPSSQPRN